MNITYTQAVIDYQAAGERLDKQSHDLKNGIASFLKGAKALVISNSESVDKAKLQTIEKELQA